MMTLEQQVTSLELSKKLKKLGVKQKSLFMWHNFDQLGWSVIDTQSFEEQSSSYSTEDVETSVSAFTVAELGEMLPNLVGVKKNGQVTNVCLISGKANVWWVRYENLLYQMYVGQQEADTEADARAKMFIHLLENDLITPHQ